MSEPESESKELKPVSEAEPATAKAQEFDLLAFWIQYRKTVIRVLVLVLIGVAIYFGFEFARQRKLAESAQALASAKSSDDFRKVSADWAGTPAAGSALLRLGDELRREGKYDESAAAIREFGEKYPKSELQDRALISLAITLELAGKTDEAFSTYQRVVSTYATSSAAEDAQVRQARILRAKGKMEEAQRILAALEQQQKDSKKGSLYLNEAQALAEEIKNPNGRVMGGNPRPVQPEPVAPETKPAPGGKPVVSPAPVRVPPAAPVPPAAVTPAPPATKTPPAPEKPAPIK